MKRLNSTKVALLSGLALLPAMSCEAAPKKSDFGQPNVIFILVDDLGIGDLGCYGQEQIKTPGIDALAASGMKFTTHYSGSTVSAPSRCVLMTGKHTGNSYIRGNSGQTGKDGRKYDRDMIASEVTVAEIFKSKDYKTACVGKWGLGSPGGQGHPNKQGFDYFFGYLGQANAHYYYPDQLFENNDPVMLNHEVYSHDLIMEKALKFVEDNANDPFFIYLTPTIPHAELLVPEGELMGYEGKFLEIPYVNNKSTGYCSQPQPRATFAAMVSRLDRDVQRLMDLLKEKGIDENTIVIFSSDNGTHREGGHLPEYFDSNGPFRGNKRDLYDGGIRTPFIVNWPAQIAPGSVSFHRSAFWDFLPTACDLIGADVPEGVNGISYLPTISGVGKQKAHDYLYFEFHEQGGKQAVVQGEWKLIRLDVNTPAKTRLELYNTSFDPGEASNVAAQYPEKVAELVKLMDSSRKTNPIFKFAAEKQAAAAAKQAAEAAKK
ncbi:MAG: arylsulfatase [Rikenellaceae bacterium]